MVTAFENGVTFYFVDNTWIWCDEKGVWKTKEKNIPLTIHFVAKMYLLLSLSSLKAMKKEYSAVALTQALHKTSEAIMWLDQIIQPHTMTHVI